MLTCYSTGFNGSCCNVIKDVSKLSSFLKNDRLLPWWWIFKLIKSESFCECLLARTLWIYVCWMSCSRFCFVGKLLFSSFFNWAYESWHQLICWYASLMGECKRLMLCESFVTFGFDFFDVWNFQFWWEQNQRDWILEDQMQKIHLGSYSICLTCLG